MNPEVQTTFASPDPNASPLNLIQLVDLLKTLVSSTIMGSYIPYVVSSTQPSVDDQDKAWIELDTSGRPKSIRTFYNGTWRRVYNGMLGEIRGFSGDPGYGPLPKNFNVDGLGNIGGDYDGWGLCNGKGGRPDFSNSFLCGANMNPAPGKPSGYDGGWQTLIEPGDIIAKPGGGAWVETLKPSNIPAPATPEFALYEWTATGNNPANPGDLYGLHNTAAKKDIILPASDGNPSPEAVFIGPPFLSLAWMIFVGYA